MKTIVQIIAWMVTKKQELRGPTSRKHLEEVCQFSHVLKFWFVSLISKNNK